MRNVVGVRYGIDAPPGRSVELQLLPFVSLRDFHATRRANSVRFDTHAGERHVAVRTGEHAVHVESDGGTFVRQDGWWYDHFYAIEADRGLDDMEDLFTPGRFVLKVTGSASITLWAALQSPARHDWDDELRRRREAMEQAECGDPWHGRPARVSGAPNTGGSPVPPKSLTIQKLTRAANDFIVTRKKPDGSPGTTVVAGYPWFADWGRDTFISLPGLLLTTGRFEQARQVLTVFARYVSQGMIPNKFDDYTNEPHYNTVDASLWFVHAAFEYARLSGDAQTMDTVLRPACRQILDGYRAGTRFGIRMDEADCLITQGDANTQLTWMDAKCGGVAFTPRQGKPVEINALWYHALRLMGETSLADRARESFVSAFWISPFRGLADVVNENGRDTSIRPNQVFAASLPNSPLDRDQQRAVVEVVRRELLTPVGLRTLAKSDPKYLGKYAGDQMSRDAAYHNGAIWPWPIGAFLDAYLRVNDHSPESIEQARQWLAPLLHHLDHDACIGQISEIFEADEPHRPVGCCAQAWSVAEVLRLARRMPSSSASRSSRRRCC
jgi:glycogen debranching enzyme